MAALVVAAVCSAEAAQNVTVYEDSGLLPMPQLENRRIA